MTDKPDVIERGLLDDPIYKMKWAWRDNYAETDDADEAMRAAARVLIDAMRADMIDKGHYNSERHVHQFTEKIGLKRYGADGPVYDCGDPDCGPCQRKFGPDRTEAIKRFSAKNTKEIGL